MPHTTEESSASILRPEPIIESIGDSILDTTNVEPYLSPLPPDMVLHQTCFEGKYKEVVAIIAAGADVNAKGFVVDEEARTFNNLHAIEAAILAAVKREVTPKALRKQAARLVKLLLNKGASVAGIEHDLMIHCANHNLSEVLEVLSNAKVRLRRWSHEILSIAMMRGHLDVIKVMGAHGCPINAANDKGSRPFLDICSGTVKVKSRPQKGHSATEGEWEDRIRQFMDLGLDLDATDKVGATPLMRAAVCGNHPLIWALVACGARSDAALRNGVSIPHILAATQPAAIVQRFVELTHTQSELTRLTAMHLDPEVRQLVDGFNHSFPA